ncbi:MAG: hypothetical protein U5K29_06690 [Acidimicrobiales bacterium]|nr:hypothetical protein [Acidimicrobiales bacterium]
MMHTYERDLCRAGNEGWPPWDQLRLTRAEDVVDLARADPTIGWATWPDVFSLDHRGSPQSWYKGFTRDSVRSWADDPSPLVEAAQHPCATPAVTNRWLIIESRLTCLYDEPVVGDHDAEAFLRLRRDLADHGYLLLDSVVFDDELHWWSLHELTSGTTIWPNRLEATRW